MSKTSRSFTHTMSRFLSMAALVVNAALAAAQPAQHQHGSAEFIENRNQWNANILYKMDIHGGALFLEQNCFTYMFKDVAAIEKLFSFKHLPHDQWPSLSADDYNIRCHACKVTFLNASEQVKVTGDEPFDVYYNYYLGNDRSKWASRVGAYGLVEYKGLYPETDLKVYENKSLLKYDITVHPGGDASVIRLLYEGADKIYIDKGNLVVETSVNKITELSPVAWQIIDGNKVPVPCKFRLNDNVVSYDFPDGYNKNFDLIIDPVLVFSTYSGSTVDNWGFTATFDSKGCAYSGGIAFGTGYPVSTGAFQVNFAGGQTGFQLLPCDIAIIKYDSTGTQRLWASYLGGSKNELPHSMIVNRQDDLLVYGTTGSDNFPVTPNAYDQTFNGGASVLYDNVLRFMQGLDIFVTKIAADGSAILASTFIGGTGNDGLNAPSALSFNYGDGARGEIMTDYNNNVYIASTTFSNDFPVTLGAFQPALGGGQDGIVVKLDKDLSSTLWASYLGGSDADAVYGIVLDNNNDVFVTGGTSSTNFPTTNNTLHPAYQGGTADGFITRISSDGSSILRSTYYGSDAYDQSYLIARGPGGEIHVYGQTSKTGSAFIQNATWATPGGGQFVSKMQPDLSTLIWSTAFGTGNGGPDISPNAFLVDDCRNVYMSGWGGSTNGFGGTAGLPVTSDAYQPSTDGDDFYFLVIDENASAMVYATYLGSPSSADHVDGGTSRFDRKGIIYNAVCAGCGSFDDFPTTPGAWSRTNNSDNCNNAVVKFDFQLAGVLAIANLAPTDTGCGPYTVNFTSSTNGVSSFWDFGDPASGTNNTSTLVNPTHVYQNAGTYNILFIATDSSKCNIRDTAQLTITVVDVPDVSLGMDTAICTGETIVLDAGNPGRTYLWSTGATSQTITVADTGNYWVVVLNGNCVSYDSVGVRHRADFSYLVPNVFTPNGDGHNDTFMVKSTGLTELDAQVFNRWGRLVYKWTDPNSGWNGKIKGNNASEGVYYYVIKLKGYCGQDEVHGFVTLMK